MSNLGSDHPFLRRKEMPFWVRQEKELAKDVRARTTPGSGSTPLPQNKADVQNRLLICEAKGTKKGSYRLAYGDLMKLVRQAIAVGKIPILHVHFEREEVAFEEEVDWVALPHRIFKEMYDVFERERSGISTKVAPKNK